MAVACERQQWQNMRVVDGGMQRPVSALGRGVQITELCDGSSMNPEPLMQQESPVLRDRCLSPTRLQLLTGCEQLERVSSAELKVDTSQASLNNFGLLLPNLTVLKLSGSVVPNIRDLGSSLDSVEVLWMRGCAVQELDGICAMGRLRELYLAYNDITDLSPLSLLDLLEILDLEGNNVDDVGQLDYLALCYKLQHLTLEGNPLCQAPQPDGVQDDYDYRGAVKRVLTNLRTLDDKPLSSEDSGSSSPQNAFDADWAFLEELQGDALLIESLENESEAVSDAGRPTTAALLPATAYRPGSALKPASASRPLTSAARRPASISGGRPSSAWTESSKPRPASSDGAEGVEAASELTCGLVICGNPSKALRAHRHREAAKEEATPSGLPCDESHASKSRGSSRLELRPASAARKQREEKEGSREDGGGEEEEMGEEGGAIEDKDLTHLLQELQSWKKEHEKRLEKIRESKAAQVLRIDAEGGSGSSVLPEGDADSASDTSMEWGDAPATSLSSSQHLSASHAAFPSSERYESVISALPPGHNCTEKLVTRRSSSSSFRDLEKCVDEDSGLLKEYKRPSVLEKPPERERESEHASGDHSCLRELRVPSGSHRLLSHRRVVVPSPSGTRMAEPPLSQGRESPPKDRRRKVRIGPTGLPGSSHSKHSPVGELTPGVTDRGGAPMPPSVHRPPLPPSASQHRVRRSLPEITPLPSRPTSLFRS